jgi:hypothetical protein
MRGESGGIGRGGDGVDGVYMIRWMGRWSAERWGLPTGSSSGGVDAREEKGTSRRGHERLGSRVGSVRAVRSTTSGLLRS